MKVENTAPKQKIFADDKLNTALTQALNKPINARDYKQIKALLKQPFSLNPLNLKLLLMDKVLQKLMIGRKKALLMIAELLIAASKDQEYYDMVPLLLDLLITRLRDDSPQPQRVIRAAFRALIETAQLAARQANPHTENITLKSIGGGTATLETSQLATLAIMLQVFINNKNTITKKLKGTTVEAISKALRQIVLVPKNHSEILFNILKASAQRPMHNRIGNTLLFAAAQYGTADAIFSLSEFIHCANALALFHRAVNNPDTTQQLLFTSNQHTLFEFATTLVNDPQLKNAAAADTIFFGEDGVLDRLLDDNMGDSHNGAHLPNQRTKFTREMFPLLQHLAKRLVDENNKIQIQIDAEKIDNLKISIINSHHLTIDDKASLFYNMGHFAMYSEDKELITKSLFLAEIAKLKKIPKKKTQNISMTQHIDNTLTDLEIKRVARFAKHTTDANERIQHHLIYAATILNTLSQYTETLKSRYFIKTDPERLENVRSIYQAALTLFTDPEKTTEHLEREIAKVTHGKLRDALRNPKKL